jgi:hypothetical protein
MLKIAELKQEVDQEWAKDRFTEYLKSEMTDLILDTLGYMAKYELFEEAHCIEMQIITGGLITDNLKKLKRLQGRVIALNKGTKGDITDEMIQAARDYPFEELINFVRGKAPCFNHEDKDPSMQYYKNTNQAFCFSCNKVFNPIDFTMIKEGMTFKEAVRRLQ